MQALVLTIRSAMPTDAHPIAEIYNHYVLNTVVSFEEQAVSTAEMKTRVEEIAAAQLPWLVAEIAGKVIGFAYASKWKGRCAYRKSVETTIYLRADNCERGTGTQLYQALIERVRELGYHTAIGGIALPNQRSVSLHEKLRFRKVAHFEQVGYKQDRWVDVAYWQLMFQQ